jgi:YHS domain-containing protein
MTIDPVCLKHLNEREAAYKSEYRGNTYYFHSERCQRVFEGSPQDFAGKIPQIVYGDQGRTFPRR